MPGRVEGGVLQTARRFSAFGRLLIVLAVQLLAIFVVPTEQREHVAIALVLLTGWTVIYVAALRKGAVQWPIWVDAAVLAGTALAQPALDVPYLVADNLGWVHTICVIGVVIHQWQSTSWTTLIPAAGVGTAFGLGAAAVTGPTLDAVFMPAVWIVGNAAIAKLSFELLRRVARRADEASVRYEQARTEAGIAYARRVSETEHLAALHDTAAATLMMVGLGTVAPDQPWLREQAARDLRVLTDAPATVEAKGLHDTFVDVAESSGIDVRIVERGRMPLQVTTAATAALAGATREALRNVQKHARVGSADVVIDAHADRLIVEIRDHGTGWTADPSTSTGRGIRESIVHRMARAGGRGQVTSSADGVTVRLEWPATTPGQEPDSAADRLASSVRLERVVSLSGVIVIAAVIAWALPIILISGSSYRSPATQLAVWGTFVALLVVADRGRGADRHQPWEVATLAVIMLAASAVSTQAMVPADLLTPAHWAWKIVPWFLTLLLLRFPVRVLAAVLFGHLTLAITQLIVTGHGDRAALSELALAGFAQAAACCGTALTVQLVRRTGSVADQTIAAEADVDAADRMAEELRQDRQRRYQDIAGTAIPLLEGFRSGGLSPANREIQIRCAVEAARLRRLMAESDETADPLLHELRASVRVAEQAGVEIDLATLGTSSGTGVEPDRAVRRALIEPVIAALAGSPARAWVTVVSTEADVVVSVAADGADDEAELPVRRDEGVETDVIRMPGRIWVSARWVRTVAAERGAHP